MNLFRTINMRKENDGDQSLNYNNRKVIPEHLWRLFEADNIITKLGCKLLAIKTTDIDEDV